jgi:tRNA threonylcarbamoyladenosine biosynthesis protein TsaE
MNTPAELLIDLPDPEATSKLGQRLAPWVRAGDALLLDGPIGAGKTHFARALIQSRLRSPEDVPSPTFTLVQVYDADDVEIWHADLYRLSHPDEAAELGLEDAFESAVCIVEWPEKLGQGAPRDALKLRFAVDGEGRQVTLSSSSPRWAPVFEALARG